MTTLANKNCGPCNGTTEKLPLSKIDEFKSQLHADWKLDTTNASIQRKFAVKGFSKAVYITNLCVWLADQQGHHPDLAFGWGYCTVTLTTHDIGGLSENDFIWAFKLDRLVSE